MTIQSHVQKSALGALLTFFEVDTTVIGGTHQLYFHNGTDQGGQPIVWQGVTYQPWAIDAKGFDTTTRGTLPRPLLTISNVSQTVSALLRLYDDLIGAKVIRRRTYEKFLDGSPDADPTQHHMDDIYFVEKKVSETHLQVEMELASALDLMGVKLPNRTIIAGSCTWAYRSPECSYTGSSYFNVLNQPVSTLEEDVCSQAVGGCKARFGPTGRLPFGGFPAARIYRS